MKYIADYVTTYHGNIYAGIVVLPSEGVPKVGDVLDVRVAGRPMPIQINNVNLRKEIYGLHRASFLCSIQTI
jgi:hypothetical protein